MTKPNRGAPVALAFRAEDLLREKARTTPELVKLLGCSERTVRRILEILKEHRGAVSEGHKETRVHSIPRRK